MNPVKVPKSNTNGPHCQHFVVRKKRLCRMTVRPGGQYCGEHEPHPKTEDGKTDQRIPCPNDPKHTCYISKLEKHLAICNARQGELLPYEVPNINAPPATAECPRKPLSQIPKETLMQIIEKVNHLYEKHIKDEITTAPERPIHESVLEEFNESDRTESSLRHLRQASRLLWLAEDEGLVQEGTCYVELGAGKGQMSYYMGVSWCGGASRVLLVDRAALRHKRDNRLRGRSTRLRADLAHLALHRVPDAQAATALVGLAKHLCGVATDYAMRCLTGAETAERCRGAVLATCCHHRCERAHYVANEQLEELGINGPELNVMLGMVSWATCGDGLSRDARARLRAAELDEPSDSANTHTEIKRDVDIARARLRTEQDEPSDNVPEHTETNKEDVVGGNRTGLSQEERGEAGRRAKALLDWGRVLYLRRKGFNARLCRYVPSEVSLENVCIVAKKPLTVVT